MDQLVSSAKPRLGLVERVSTETVPQALKKRHQAEYDRKGVCHQFMMCEPLRGWRTVRVTHQRTRRDYAEAVRGLLEVHYPKATRIRLVQDNLNTHDGASLYEAFAADVARRLLDRIEFHYTPRHG